MEKLITSAEIETVIDCVTKYMGATASKSSIDYSIRAAIESINANRQNADPARERAKQ